jgi:dihydrofolate reductase
MAETILYIATSLDGFVAGKNDDLSWLTRYQHIDYGFDEFFNSVGAMIQGRRAYDIEKQQGWEYPHPVPTFVLTHEAPKEKPKRSDIIFTDGDIGDVLSRAKSITDKNVWVEGGAAVAQQFLKRDLLDRIVIAFTPTILGEGIRLFDNIDRQIEFDLREVKHFDEGLVQLTYVRAAARSGATT